MRQLIMDGDQLNMNADFPALGALVDALGPLIPQGRLVSSIYLDDDEVLADLEVARQRPLARVDTVRVQTDSVPAAAASSVEGLLQCLKEVRPLMRQAGRELRYGSVPEATTKLVGCFEGLETTIRSVETLVQLLEGSPAAITPEELMHFSGKEAGLMGELVGDFSRRDWASLADRLEFQLDPLLGRWQKVLNRVLGSLLVSRA